MTSIERVRRTRNILVTTTLLGAVAWSAAIAVIAFSVVNVLGVPAIKAMIVAGIASLITATALLWKVRSVWSLEHVALWIEEQLPELKYALVTLVDARRARIDQGSGFAALDDVARRADINGITWHAVRRGLGRGAVAIVIAGIALMLSRVYPALASRVGSSGKVVAPTVLPNRLAALRVEIVSPTYSGVPPRIVSNPASVTGLVGSKLRFAGDGPAEGITAIVSKDTIGKETLVATMHDRGWAVPLAMPSVPGIVRLNDRQYTASVVLEPVTDSAPRVVLRQPIKDTTYHPERLPRGMIELEAEIEDDFGIETAFFEILVSTGGAESFDTKDRSTPRVAFAGKRRGTLRTSLSYASLGLAPGTVLHIRAVAFDRNDIASAPGKGVSETRTIRVATKQEYDASNVTPAPPLPIDTLYVSQRLLNARTDTLIRIRARVLAPSLVVDTSVVYGNVQTDIRQRVEKTIEIAEDDGVGGRAQTATSRLLREASEQMYMAFTFLAIGQPEDAYDPHMQDALRLLDEARSAQKYYVRGVLAARPVNIANVRLQAHDTASAAERRGREVPEDLRRRLQARLAGITPLAKASAPGAIDSLMAVWVAALRAVPEVGGALKEAVELARQGKDVSVPLARARRLLDPPAKATVGPPEWAGMLP